MIKGPLARAILGPHQGSANSLYFKVSQGHKQLDILTWVGSESKRHYTPSQHDTDCKQTLRTVEPLSTQPTNYKTLKSQIS